MPFSVVSVPVTCGHSKSIAYSRLFCKPSGRSILRSIMAISEQLAAYLRAAPKAELHVHLEGSIQPATLLALAARNGVALPAQTVDELQQWFRYRDFNHFIEIYFAITSCLKQAEDYELIAYRSEEHT